MAALINTTASSTSWTNKIYPLFENGQKRATDPQGPRIASMMHRIIGEEQVLAKQALSDPWRRYPVSIIGGSILNVAEFALEGASVFAPCAAIADLLIGIGFLGAIFNIKEGALSIDEGLRALQVNDKKLGVRLLLQGTLLSLFGAGVLVLTVARIVSLSLIIAFFAANPYVLPTIYFSLSIFFLIETLHRLVPIIQGKDLGTKLELPKLRSMLKTTDPERGMEIAAKWVHSKTKECRAAEPVKNQRSVQTKLNEYKAEIGFTAAMEVFKLFEMILQKKKKEEILEQIETAEKKISAWNQTLYLKVFSVLLAGAGFGAGMGSIALHTRASNGAQNLAMSVAGVVPLYLDVCKPFEREIPIVIHRPEAAKATEESLRHTP